MDYTKRITVDDATRIIKAVKEKHLRPGRDAASVMEAINAALAIMDHSDPLAAIISDVADNMKGDREKWDYLDKVHKAADRLLKAIGQDAEGGPAIPSWFYGLLDAEAQPEMNEAQRARRHGASPRSVVQDVVKLRDWAAAALAKVGNERRESGPKDKTEFIGAVLADAYVSQFKSKRGSDDRPGVSIPFDGGDPDGPFVRFVQEIYGALGEKAPTGHAIREAVKTMDKRRKEAESQ